MIDTIIFDVDGTLVDTEYVVINSLKKTLKEELNHIVEEDDLNFALGIPGQTTLERFLDSEVEIKRVHKKWEINESKLSHHAEVFEDMENVLQILTKANYKLGIVTSKTRKAMISDFNPLGLEKYFEVIITASDTDKHKPNPDPLLKALKELNAEGKRTIYIGDSIYDMRSAQNSGILFGLAEWGALDYEEFKNADIKFEKPKDILTYFDK